MKKALLVLALVLMVGGIALAIPEDTNNDGKVDLTDIMTVALAFGSYATITWIPPVEDDPETPDVDETAPGYWLVENAHPRYNLVADINKDGKVDLTDYMAIALKFGWVAPKE